MYDWDAENRLTAVMPLATPSSGWKKCQFEYDYQGRRTDKRVFTHNGANWGSFPTETRRFVWYNWLMLMEIVEKDTNADGTLEETRTRKYTWGRDLGSMSSPSPDRQGAGLLESAGGIGGLLAVEDDNGNRW